jgi:hypothetical protein
MEENKQIQTVDSNTEIVDVKGASNKLAAMMEFLKANLIKGTDYMSIGGGKPTLLKSGAEKMNVLFGIYAEYETTEKIMTVEPPFYYVQIKAILRNKQGQKVGEGLASCNSDEANQIKTREKTGVSIYSQLNTILKMAEKRAYVGATLNANALSQFYTQDLEDNEDVIEVEKKESVKDSSGASYHCIKCGVAVTEKVAKFSTNKYGMILCMKDQDAGTPLGEWIPKKFP